MLWAQLEVLGCKPVNITRLEADELDKYHSFFDFHRDSLSGRSYCRFLSLPALAFGDDHLQPKSKMYSNIES